MQWTGLNELREKYLSFFESKGHLRLDSFPLVPKNDPSLLLINSGMAPMKKWFLAQEEPPRHRVTTCQEEGEEGVFKKVNIEAIIGENACTIMIWGKVDIYNIDDVDEKYSKENDDESKFWNVT